MIDEDDDGLVVIIEEGKSLPANCEADFTWDSYDDDADDADDADSSASTYPSCFADSSCFVDPSCFDPDEYLDIACAISCYSCADADDCAYDCAALQAGTCGTTCNNVTKAYFLSEGPCSGRRLLLSSSSAGGGDALDDAKAKAAAAAVTGRRKRKAGRHVVLKRNERADTPTW